MNTMQTTQPSFLDIAARVAPENPQLAYHLLRNKGAQRRLGFQTLKVTIPDGTPDKPYEATFPTTLGEDFYVLDIRSTVSRPDYLAGSPYKAQADFYNALNPGINVRMQVVGGVPGRRYVLNDYYAALEILAPNANGQGKSIVSGMDAVLEYSQTIKADFVLTRQYEASEIPVIVELSFLGWSLGCEGYYKTPINEAVLFLAKQGGTIGNLGKELADHYKVSGG